MSEHDRQTSGFKERTRVGEARDRLLSCVDPHGRVEHVDLADADDRVVARPLAATDPVPPAPRAAMDGFAVRAADTFGSSDRSPGVLRLREGAPSEATVGPEEAVRVHTGSALPEGADAVVMVEETDVVGPEVEVFDAVAEGENVAPTGEDVSAGQDLYDAGHRLRPSDLGLLKSVGRTDVPVFERPTVSVIPTGDELVSEDPGPGETIETNGLTLRALAERWGGQAVERDPVPDDEALLREAIERDLDQDLVVTSGGSSVGQRDLLPEVLEAMGEFLFHGVALKPGHPVGVAIVEETPVVMLPGYPVSCIIGAVEFLRPAIARLLDTEPVAHPTSQATLTRKVPSSPGTRTYARVEVETTDEGREATPTRTSGAGVLSSVALAEGWVVVPESVEGYDAGRTVAVENWEPGR